MGVFISRVRVIGSGNHRYGAPLPPSAASDEISTKKVEVADRNTVIDTAFGVGVQDLPHRSVPSGYKGSRRCLCWVVECVEGVGDRAHACDASEEMAQRSMAALPA